jgi:hypothetical protein
MAHQYYAVQRPRGIVNDVVVYHFPSRPARDAWVDEINDANDNSAACGAYAITRSEARCIVQKYLATYGDWQDYLTEGPGQD